MAAELGAGWGAVCKMTVRGALDALAKEDPLDLAEATATGAYSHSLDTDQAAGGTVGVAVQAITLNLNYSQDRHEVNTGNLTLTARYVRKEPAPALPGPEKPADG